jgi:hypothetical protein
MDNLIEGYSSADDADHSKPAPDIFAASLDKHAGVSVDTTMRFSPTGGLMMGTRCRDLDLMVMTCLSRMRSMTPDAKAGAE